VARGQAVRRVKTPDGRGRRHGAGPAAMRAARAPSLLAVATGTTLGTRAVEGNALPPV